MTKEELKKHCLKQVEACEMWAKHNGEEPHGKVYEEHKLILELLEQEPDTWSLNDAREDFMSDVYDTLDFLPTNDEANRIIDSFDRVTSGIKKESKTDWIPVSERLPETDEDVLITDGVTVYIGWINAINRQWRANCFINNVTAYMPLPEPYKGDEDD